MVSLARPPGGTPLVSRQEGQRLARTELSKAIYHPHHSLAGRLLDMISRLLHGLYDAGKSFPGGWWAVVALAALAGLVIALVAARLGPLARAHREAGPLAPGGRPLRAAGHRQRAGRLAAAGDYTGATLESVRAIARELEERGVLSPRLGRTAAEIAAEAGQELPGEAGPLQEAARLFDDICYGERPGTAAGYEFVQALDTRILAARPRGGGAGPAGIPAGTGAGASARTGGAA